MESGRSSRAIVVLVLLLAAVFGVAGATKAAAQTDSSSQAGAGWLASQLVDGDHFEGEFDGQRFPDQGLTADAVLAFDAADVAQDFARAATSWLARPDIYTGYLGSGTESYAGPHAKLALVAIAQGLDPTAFGPDSVDLIGGLQLLQAPSGRFSDKSAFADFSNAITQSLAVISLVRVDEDASAGAAYLAGAQCDDGGFPLKFEQPECNSEPDATGFVVQALLAAGLDGEAGSALDYLESVQRAGGGFGGIGPTEPTNANSTAMAAQALRAGGRDEAADAAVEYLTSLQVGCSAPAEQHGAIVYDTNGFDLGSALRASAQAVPALAGAGLLEVDNAGDAGPAPTSDCPAPPTTTQPAPQPGPAPQLPATGGPVVPSLLAGSLLVLTGAALALAARRRFRVRSGREAAR